MSGHNLRGFTGQGLDGQRTPKFFPLVYAQSFTSGSGTTPPQTVPVRAYVYVLGGGGGGGGYLTPDGGGGGGASCSEFTLSPGQTLAYSVGAGGLAGQSAPSSGGDTTVTGPTGQIVRGQGAQGRLGGQGVGGSRNFQGGNGGPFGGTGPNLGGAAGSASGGDGSNGGGGGGVEGGGGGGAAAVKLPAGLIASTYAAGAGGAGTVSGGASLGANYGSGGGASSDINGGSPAGAAGRSGVAIILMHEIGRQ